ncbi:MAG: hypothetical protein WAN86_19320 [Hyphomicrobiaceae bacterium]
MRLALAMVAVTLTGGCATPYQSMGFTGGVEAQQMTANSFRIVARGNGYTPATTVQDYAILKAAETTKQAGGTHFAIISASDASSAGHVVVPGQAHTSVVGRTAYTTYTPATAYRFVRPGQDVYIRVLTVQPGRQPPPGAFSADEIIRYVGGRVKREEQ